MREPYKYIRKQIGGRRTSTASKQRRPGYRIDEATRREASDSSSGRASSPRRRGGQSGGHFTVRAWANRGFETQGQRNAS